MKLLMRCTLLLVLITSLLTSCKKKVPKQTRHIPKEATVVATINSKSLQNKLIKSQATMENLLKNLSSNQDSALDKGKKEWEDLRNSGIDLDEEIYIAFEQKGGGMAMGNTSGVVSVLGSVKDADKLQAYIKKKKPAANIMKEKDYNYSIENNDIVGWNDDVVIALTYQKSYAGGMEYDSATGNYNLSKPKDVVGAADLVSEMSAYMNRKEETSVASIAEFRDLMQEKSDASLWVNSGSSLKDLPLPMPKLKELVENAYTAATLSFEDAKVVMNSKSYLSKPLADIVEKHSGSKVDLGLIETYPSSNIDGFMISAFNPEILSGIVSYLEVGGMVDGYLTQFMGSTFTLKDLLKIFKGDFAIIASDYTASTGQQSANLPIKGLFNATVGDKTQLYRVLDKLVTQQMLVKSGNEYRLNPVMSKAGMYVTIDDKNILAGTDSLLISQYRAKTGKAVIDKDILNDFKGKTMGVFVDLAKIMAALPQNDQSYDSVLVSAKQTFKNMKASGDVFNGKYAEGHYELQMVNDKENSLTSLIKFFAVAGDTFRKKQANADAGNPGMQVDSTATGTIDTTRF